MDYQEKTKAALIAELQTLRRRVAYLESQLSAIQVAEPFSPDDGVDLTPARPTEIEPWGTFIHDTATGSISCSPELLEILGLSTQTTCSDLKAMLSSLIHPEDLSTVRPQMKRMVIERKTWPIEFRIVRPDGTIRLLRCSAQLALDAAHSPTQAYGLLFDITEQRHTTSALEMSESKYRTLFETMTQGVVYQDRTGAIIAANPAAERIFGLDAAQLIGQSSADPLWQAVHEDGTSFPGETHPAIVALRTGEVVSNVVMGLFNAKEGRLRWIRVSAVPEFRPGEREPYQVFTTFEDITDRKLAQDRLQESEEQFSLFMDYLPGAVFIKDAEGYLRFCNCHFAAAAGTTPEAIIGKHSVEYMEPEAAAAFIEENRRVLQEDRVYRYEHTFSGLDGPSYWLTIKFPIHRSGKQDLLGSMSLEITERKKMEAALAESEQRFRMAAQSISDLIYELDIASGTLKWFGDIDSALGYPQGAFPHTVKAWLDHIHPEDRTRLKQALDLRYESTAVMTEQYRIRGKDGTWRYWMDHSEPILNDDGKPIRWIGACVDISAQQRNQSEREALLSQIRAQAQRTQQIIETVPEGVLLVNASGNILLSNPAGEAHLNILAANTMQGERLTQLSDQTLAEILSPPAGQPWQEIKATGHIYEVSAHPIREGNETLPLWVLVTRDVTQEREGQRRVQLQERLATVGQMAAGIAHDFNNVIATIVLYAQMLERSSGIQEGDHRYLRTIVAQAQHATGLITQILDFSRSQDFEREDMDLVPLVKEAVKLWQRTFPETIRVTLDYQENTLVVHGEPNRLNQMLTNLALNARDAMNKGGVLHIDLRRIEVFPAERPLPEMEPGMWVRITVQDTGTGIPHDVLPHIFDPFFTTKPAGKGAGLGLAQVYGIVQTHHGHIDVQTQIDAGTTFVIYLPAIPIEDTQAHAHMLEGVLPIGHGEKLLVVEDDAMLRAALITSLEDLNYRVIGVTNGEEALSYLDDHMEAVEDPIQLVITDMVMPVMGGMELLQSIHERRYPVAVIVLTGYSIETAEDVDLPELIAWQQKPIDLNALAAAIVKGLTR